MEEKDYQQMDEQELIDSLKKDLGMIDIPEDKLEPEINVDWVLKYILCNVAKYARCGLIITGLKQLLFWQHKREGRI